LFCSSQVALLSVRTPSLTQSSRARKQVVNSGPVAEASKVCFIDFEMRSAEGESVLRRGRRSERAMRRMSATSPTEARKEEERENVPCSRARMRVGGK